MYLLVSLLTVLVMLIPALLLIYLSTLSLLISLVLAISGFVIGEISHSFVERDASLNIKLGGSRTLVGIDGVACILTNPED